MANPIKGAVAGVKLVNMKAKMDGKTLSVGKAVKGAVAGLKNPSAVKTGLAQAKGAQAMAKRTAERLKDPTVQAKLKALQPHPKAPVTKTPTPKK